MHLLRVARRSGVVSRNELALPPHLDPLPWRSGSGQIIFHCHIDLIRRKTVAVHNPHGEVSNGHSGQDALLARGGFAGLDKRADPPQPITSGDGVRRLTALRADDSCRAELADREARLGQTVLPTQHFAEGSRWARYFGPARMIARDVLLQVAQVLATLLLAPLAAGRHPPVRGAGAARPGPGSSNLIGISGSCSTSRSSSRRPPPGSIGRRPIVAFTDDVDGADPHSGADQLSAAAFRYGRHPGRRAHSDARLVHDHARGSRHRAAPMAASDRAARSW